MTKLTILRGVSGSGKSTWAEAQAGNVLIVSRDRLRLAYYGSNDQDYYQTPDIKMKERAISILQDATIEAALRSGQDVIVDNTNVEWKYVKALAKIANKVGAEVEVKVFDVDYNKAFNWNERRAANGGRLVPSDVIKRQHEQLSKTKNLELPVVPPVRPYEGTPGKPKAFMVDVDGTLAHMRDYRGPFEWHNVGLDDLDEVIADIVFRLGLFEAGTEDRLRVIVMSGRDAACQNETLEWLQDNAIPFDMVCMRPEGDMRPDNIVKAELFDKHVRDNFDVQFVLDDRQQVVDMWRSMGLTCLQVAEGAF